MLIPKPCNRRSKAPSHSLSSLRTFNSSPTKGISSSRIPKCRTSWLRISRMPEGSWLERFCNDSISCFCNLISCSVCMFFAIFSPSRAVVFSRSACISSCLSSAVFWLRKKVCSVLAAGIPQSTVSCRYRSCCLFFSCWATVACSISFLICSRRLPPFSRIACRRSLMELRQLSSSCSAWLNWLSNWVSLRWQVAISFCSR